MKNLKFNKKYYKIGSVVATKSGIGIIIGFKKDLTSFYLYLLTPMDIVSHSYFYSDTYFDSLEHFLDELYSNMLISPMKEKLLLTVKTSTTKIYLDKQYDKEDIILWRNKNKLINQDKTEYKDTFEFDFKFEKGMVYSVGTLDKKQYIYISASKMINIDYVDDLKAGKYDDRLRCMKYYRWSADGIAGIKTLRALKTNGVITPVNKKEDISWFEEKWNKL